jgi:hemoglobin
MLREYAGTMTATLAGMSAIDSPSLYERIGGASALDDLIEAFYIRVLADPILAPFFHDTPLDRLRKMQKEFFAMALGGPIAYSGRSLAHAHHGRGVKREHFAHFVQHLVETLKDIGVSQGDADHVIDHINTFANEITGTSY